MEILSSDENVVLEAAPGAGKTYWLKRVCSQYQNTLFLAYNTQLATELRADPQLDGALCLTFHALCARCIGPTRDDAQLQEHMDALERGERVVKDVPGEVDCVVIDEAQDVRPLYVRLLRSLGVLQRARVIVAGDANQLIYDFDPQHPASLHVLREPEVAFGPLSRGWMRVKLDASYRLTRPIATFVNALFRTGITAEREGPPVELRCPSSMFQLHDCLSDVWEGAGQRILVLVDRKKGNHPLRALLNRLSRDGTCPLYVHGLDEDSKGEECARPGITLGTFWSAKGLECDTVVVLLPDVCPLNPAYVACTRASQRMILVIDPKAPNAAACRAATDGLAVCADGRAQRAALTGSGLPPSDSWGIRRGSAGTHPPICTHRLSASWQVGNPLSRAPTQRVLFRGRDVTEAVVRAALVLAEVRQRGWVRAYEQVRHPLRLDACQRSSLRWSVEPHVFVGRPVGRTTPDSDILAPDLRQEADRAYAVLQGWSRGREPFSPLPCREAATVALSLLAWDDFDHLMRGALPVEEWADSEPVRDALAHALSCLPYGADAEYDVPTGHGRVHAADSHRLYHVSWNATTQEERGCALRAGLCAHRTCLLLDLSDGSARDVLC